MLEYLHMKQRRPGKAITWRLASEHNLHNFTKTLGGVAFTEAYQAQDHSINLPQYLPFLSFGPINTLAIHCEAQRNVIISNVFLEVSVLNSNGRRVLDVVGL